MGIDFYQTIMGKRFFEGTIPALVRAIEERNSLLKENNDLLKEYLSKEEQRKQFFKELIDEKFDSLIQEIKYLR